MESRTFHTRSEEETIALGRQLAGELSGGVVLLIDVFHVDLYRLDEAREVESLGLDELFASGTLVLLEWAERFPGLLPRQRAEIRLRALADDSREIIVTRVE